MNTPVLLLHGALGAASTFEPLLACMNPDHQLHTFNFSGHGGKPFSGAHFSIAGFAKECIAFLDGKGWDKADIFGYSMGGYVGLYLARHYPERIGKVATLATKFDWGEETSAREVGMLNPDKIQEKVPQFAEMLAHRHAPVDWREVMQKTAALMLDLGKQSALSSTDFEAILQPVMVAAGDQDKTATAEETLATCRLIPHAALWILPYTPHPLEKVRMDILAKGLVDFFARP